MAVPKKRVGHSAQGHRRSNWKATKPETTTCKNCGELALTHTVCTACGYYKDKVVSIKAEGYVETQTTAKPKKTKTIQPKKSKKEVVETTEAPKKEKTVTPETEEVVVETAVVEEKTETVEEEKPEETES